MLEHPQPPPQPRSLSKLRTRAAKQDLPRRLLLRTNQPARIYAARESSLLPSCAHSLWISPCLSPQRQFRFSSLFPFSDFPASRPQTKSTDSTPNSPVFPAKIVYPSGFTSSNTSQENFFPH